MAKRPEIKDPEQGSANPGTPAPTAKALPNYLEAALRIPTSYPLGAQTTDSNASSSAIRIPNFRPAPGYMVLDYVPTLGVSSDDNSAVNRATAEQFNEIRSQISGTRPYQPADHMIYRVCVDGLRDLYFYVRRIYGVIAKYSATNLYRPRAALSAMGLDAGDWIRHAADLYQWLLMHKEALKPFPTVPIGSISSRHELFNTHMFTDGAIDSVQTYIMNQTAFWSYDRVDEVKGISLVQMPATYDEFLTVWDNMYTALYRSGDVHIIAADIKRAFPDRYKWELPDTPENYSVEYVEFDPMKEGIMNAAILGCDIHVSDVTTFLLQFRITDSEGTIICTPAFSSVLQSGENFVSIMLNHINSISDNPSSLSLLNAMRFKPVLDQSDSEGGTLRTRIQAMGTEVITGATMVGFDGEGNIITVPLSTAIVHRYSAGDSADWRDALQIAVQVASMISNFDWHPPVSITAMSDNDTVYFSDLVEDVQNYIPVSNDNLRQVHEATLLAEFGVQ